MYLRELYKAGTEKDLENARAFLEKSLTEKREKRNELLCRQIIAVLLKIYRQADDPVSMLKVSLSSEATVPSAEMCMELGYFFMKKGDFGEAAEWFSRAAFHCESEIDIASSGTSALMALAVSYRGLAKSPKLRALPQKEFEREHTRLTEKAAEYELMARSWKPAELELNT